MNSCVRLLFTDIVKTMGQQPSWFLLHNDSVGAHPWQNKGSYSQEHVCLFGAHPWQNEGSYSLEHVCLFGAYPWQNEGSYSQEHACLLTSLADGGYQYSVRIQLRVTELVV